MTKRRSTSTDRPNPARMGCCRAELSISELLSDPIVHAMMRADGVVPEHLAAMLYKVGGRLG